MFWGSGLRVLGFRVKGLGGSGFIGVLGSGFRGFGFRV